MHLCQYDICTIVITLDSCFRLMAFGSIDTSEMTRNFFRDAAFAGIASPLPVYRFCWLLNTRLEMDFRNMPEYTIEMGVGKGNKLKRVTAAPAPGLFADASTEPPAASRFYFPTFIFEPPASATRHIIYTLKQDNQFLVPELKHLDFLWKVEASDAEHLLHLLLPAVQQMRDVQAARLISHDSLLKSAENLLL